MTYIISHTDSAETLQETMFIMDTTFNTNLGLAVQESFPELNLLQNDVTPTEIKVEVIIFFVLFKIWIIFRLFFNL